MAIVPNRCNMPFDPEVTEFLKLADEANLPPIESLTPAEAREGMLVGTMALGTPERVHEIEDRHIPGPAGPIPIRIYRPRAAAGLPIVVFFHGGGWVVGNIDTHDGLCRALANHADALVVSVDYRLAPEHPHPAAVDDAYAATSWVAEQAAALGGDSRRMAVAGDSAGGNLSAVVAQLARDRGGPRLALQVLIYPVTDCDLDSASYLALADGYYLTRAAMRWFWELYVPQAANRALPTASPLRASSLAGLPPALVITAEYDPLVDEGEAYARRLTQAGVATTLTRYPGMIHGFARRLKLFTQARAALEEMSAAVRRMK